MARGEDTRYDPRRQLPSRDTIVAFSTAGLLSHLAGQLDISPPEQRGGPRRTTVVPGGEDFGTFGINRSGPPASPAGPVVVNRSSSRQTGERWYGRSTVKRAT